ncbi:MAG: TlpA disulfide reductase family protein [Lysinibacillus sp.]
MKKSLIGKVIVFGLVVIMLGTFIKQQIDKSEAVISTGYEVDLTDEVGVKQGQIAPDFNLQTLDGETVKLSDYEGKKVVVNFWATWCTPCRTEMPHMQKYYEKHAEKDNVEILALNLTFDDKGPENVRKFVNSYDLTFPILLMENDNLLTTYEVLVMPSSIFIDTKGRVQRHFAGVLDQEKLIHYVGQLN